MAKRFGIITRDCAGINAALRAVVRTATGKETEVFGILRGYDGLIDGELRPLDRRAVSGIINLGGNCHPFTSGIKARRSRTSSRSMELLKNSTIIVRRS